MKRKATGLALEGGACAIHFMATILYTVFTHRVLQFSIGKPPNHLGVGMTPFITRALRLSAILVTALALALGSPRTALAQAAGAVSGNVVDAKTGSPLADATVLAAGTTIQARTGSRGDFRLAGLTETSVRLTITRVGYQAASLTATVGGQPLRITLAEFVVKLDELVVTGAAGDQQQRTLGNVVGKVDVAATVLQAPPAKLQDMLSVNIPGVRVVRGSGGVGSGGTTRIRGAGSLSLVNEPLIYVDGIRVNNQGAVNSEAFAGGQESPSRINDLNPEEIESIQVLKGPSAATIYGTEASNGVIQITTKRGKAGKPVFDVHLDAGANWISNPDGRYADTYYYSPTTQKVTAFDVQQHNRDLGYPDIFRTGGPLSLGASVSGGTESVRYYAGADYGRDEGAVSYNWQNKLTTRANVSYTSPKFRADLSLGTVTSKLQGASGFQPITTSIVWSCPFPGCEPTPGPDSSTTGYNDITRGFIGYRPEDYDQVEGLDQIDRTTLSLRLSHNPTSWLRHSLVVGPDYTNDRSSLLVNRFAGYNPFFSQGLGYKSSRQVRTTWITADYGAAADAHLTTGLVSTTSVGAQYYVKRFEQVYAQGQTFAIPGPSDVNGGATILASEAFLENKTFGVYAQEQLAWKNRLFMTAALRGDDNSAFGSNFGAVYYPKFSLAWVASDEPFLANSSVVSQLKLRGAWGRAGQQPDVFFANQTYVPAAGPGGQGGVTPQNFGNQDLKPEIATETEIGFDAGLFKNRMGVEFTYYKKDLDDAILSLPLKPSRGFPGNQYANIGKTVNSGIELALDGSPVNNEKVGLDLRLTYATNDSKLTDMGGAPSAFIGAAYIQQYYVEGYAPGSYFYKHVVSSTIQTIPVAGIPLGLGFNAQCEGGTRIMNPDGSATPLGVADGTIVPCSEAPQLYSGRPTPSWSGSFSANLRLGKRLQILAVLDYMGGNVIEVGDVMGAHHFFLNSQAVLTGTNEILAGSLGEQFLNGDGGQTYGMDGLFKAGFAKLRTVSATYEMPTKVARWVGASRGSITFSGENLATLWQAQKDIFGVPWLDPEITPNRVPGGIATAPGYVQYTQESFPQLMRFRTTIRLTF